MNTFKNILIVRTDRIGDVVLTTPSIKALRQAYPQARLTMLVAPATESIVRNNPYLDEVMVDDRLNVHKQAGFFKLVWEVRKRRFDLAVIFYTKRRTNFLCFLAGVPYRLGYKNEKFGFLLNHPVEDRRHEGKKHEAEYCLDLLNVIGIQSHDLELQISFDPSAERWADEFVKKVKKPSHKLIAIHVGASDPGRQWPVKCFIQLMRMIQSKYPVQFILVGDQRIKEATDIILKENIPNVYSLINQTSVSQLASLFKRCDLLVSNDSGPVHVASATGVAVVSIFTRIDPGINPERWRPLGKQVRVVSVSESKVKDFIARHPISFKVAGQLPEEYLQLIAPQEVFEAVDAFIKLC